MKFLEMHISDQKVYIFTVGNFVGEFTVKTLGPGVLNEDQKSKIQSK